MRHCLLFLVLSLNSLSAAERPNIVFLFSDDHALSAISAYEGLYKDVAPTPNIDRIAREGALFRHSFCANSICGPSRACILTGKHSHKNGYLSNDFDTFDGNQITLPKLLQAGGYQTAIIGKWHLVSEPQGFDHWNILPGQGNYYNPLFITANGAKKHNGYCTDLITDFSLDWLKNGRDPKKPFLLMCQHKAPHRNWAPALRHIGKFSRQTMPQPDSLFDDYANRSETLKTQRMTIAKDFSWGHDMNFHGKNEFPKHFTDLNNHEYERMTGEEKKAWDAVYEPENQAFLADMRAGKLSDNQITEWKHQRYIKNYLLTIKAVDESVGRILDYLESSGLAKNTIVIYSADQGFYLGEHGWYDKRWMFEESLAMPFLIRWPGVVKPGSKPTALIQNIDYAPTFLEAVGLKPTPAMQGKSFLPVLKNATEKTRDAIYYAYYGENTHSVAAHDGVRTETHKLMHLPATKEWQLFDLIKDPQEMKSVHADPTYAGALASLKEQYTRLRASYEVNDAAVPKDRLKEKWWTERHRALVQQGRKLGHPELVFLGDSITQGWEGKGAAAFKAHFGERKTLNLGFSGDRTEHVLWRLYNGEWDGIQPKAVSLLIGTNNTGQIKQSPAETAMGVRLIIEFLRERSPETKIILHSIFPRSAGKDDELRKLNDEVNRLCSAYVDNKNVHWLDMAPQFLAEDGTLSKEVMPDLLHLNETSYELWAKTLAAKLKELGL
jgi:arylsulfatase A-like enzyme/lysophospholipase L1-like esterase